MRVGGGGSRSLHFTCPHDRIALARHAHDAVACASPPCHLGLTSIVLLCWRAAAAMGGSPSRPL